jgi:HEAT repeat protein
VIPVVNIQPVRPVIRPTPDTVRQVLGEILGHGVDIHRCLAAKALGHIGGSSAVQPLTAALLDEDEDVRTDAAEALFELADPGAGQQLFENLLGDPCTDVKLAAIRTLAKLQDRRVIPWLRRMVKGRDQDIAWDEQEFFDSGWDDWVEVQIAAIAALAELDAAEAVPDIVEAIQDENAQDMTEVAFKALARLGKPGIDALGRFLDGQPVRLRRRAAAVLAAATMEEAAAPLARAFADPSAEVRAAAMRARAITVPADAGLAKLLDDSDASIRAEAVQLLGQRYPDRLTALLDDPSVSVQASALAALADIGDCSADKALITQLQAMISAKDVKVSVAAITALAALATEAALQDLIPLLTDTDRPDGIRLGALRGLATVGGAEATEALIAVIGDDSRPIRLEVMSALARLAQTDSAWPNAAGDALLSALRGRYTPEDIDDSATMTAATPEAPPEESAPRVRNEDSGAFPTSTLKSILNDTPGLEKLAGLPDEGVELTPVDMERLALARQVVGKRRVVVEPKVVGHEDIRRFAARVLGDIGHADVARELVNALASGDADLCLAAADSLTRIGHMLTPFPVTVTETLMAKLATADRALKLLLIRALGASEGETVSDMLKTLLADSDSFVRTEVVRSLFKLGKVGTEIEAMLDDPDSSTRLIAAEAIAGPGGTDAVGRLVDFSFAFEGCHGREAARLLRGMDATAASDAFVGVLHNPDRKRLWSVAIEALEELHRPEPIHAAKRTNHEEPG